MTTPSPDASARILAVDDLEENLVALEALLRRDGVVVDRARSGAEALELLLRREYAVALVDVEMPEMDGFELARLMRGAERSKHVPIVFVTAGAVARERVFEGYDAGAVDFLFKPIDPHVLRAKVRVFLELERQKRELARSAVECRRLADDARAAMQQLGETTALLDSIFENAPVGVSFVDRHLRFRRVNAAMAAMTGIGADAHLGRRIVELLPGFPSAYVEESWRRVMESGVPVVDEELEGETPGTAGRRTWKVSYYPVRLGSVVIGMGSIMRDVTGEKRAEELQGFLMGIVGHDLRTPIAAIATSVQLLLRAGGVSDRQRTVLQRMRSSVDRMSTLVADLLDFTRLRAGGGLPLDAKPTDLATVIAPVVEEARAGNPGRDVALHAEGDGSGTWDPERLRQIVANLISNALKHGEPGTPVQLAWRGAGEFVEIDVRNEGPPIPPDVLPQIFEPLVQGGEGLQRGGIGLGLFIAREIVRAHQGTIEARSDESGTLFRVRLPRSAPAESRATA